MFHTDVCLKLFSISVSGSNLNRTLKRTHIFENNVSYALVLWPVCQQLLQVSLMNKHTHKQTNRSTKSSLKITPSPSFGQTCFWWRQLRTHYLYPGVNLVDVRDAAKYRLHFLLGQDWSAYLPLFFQWKLEELHMKTERRKKVNE